MEDGREAPGSDEQCIALAGHHRLIQRRRGHRYSVDDMIVAHLACTRTPPPRRVLDLGCGLGSVLLITAWAFPDARLVGVEALEEHVAFARRNIRLNGCQTRARVVTGDLRDLALVASLGTFDLVSGSPPYFSLGSGTLCADPARAAAHFELRGGVEDYAVAASIALAPGGVFVTCAAADPPRRGPDALAGAGLELTYHQAVIPRAGKAPFLTLLVGTKPPGPKTDEVWRTVEGPPLVLRCEDGRRTSQHVSIREWTAVSRRPSPGGEDGPGDT